LLSVPHWEISLSPFKLQCMHLTLMSPLSTHVIDPPAPHPTLIAPLQSPPSFRTRQENEAPIGDPYDKSEELACLPGCCHKPMPRTKRSALMTMLRMVTGMVIKRRVRLTAQVVLVGCLQALYFVLYSAFIIPQHHSLYCRTK